MFDNKKARAVGFNHVALEVGDIDEAPAFYGPACSNSPCAAVMTAWPASTWATSSSRCKPAASSPQTMGAILALWSINKDAVRQALADAGVKTEPGPFLDFYDPWGNRIEIVGYDNIQFTKAANVLRGMGLAHLKKTDVAIAELTEKGMAPT